MANKKIFSNNKKNFFILIAFSLITLVVWQIPIFGRYILYPFTILGTWFHEMGHGLTAIMLGGAFHELIINSNGSGLASHSGSLFLGDIGRALVAAGGPLGPPIAGAAMIIASRTIKSSKPALFTISAIMIISVLLWIRSPFGIAIMLIWGILLFMAALKAKGNTQKLTLQFIGIQAFFSVYLSIGYLFSSGGVVGQSSYMSDTGHIAEYLFLPHWFWAVVILVFSFYIIVRSFKYAYRPD